jgi:bleomycin hydrolase
MNRYQFTSTRYLSIIIFSFFLLSNHTLAQIKDKTPYKFELTTQVKTTPVKNQAKTGTCWSFATTSFVETELLRMGKGEFILSPMFNVRYTYPQKALNYIRYSGTSNFAEGGEPHDVMNVIRNYGFVPEEVYDGKKISEEEHNHGEMDAVLKAIVETVNKNKGGKITPRWQEVLESSINIYLGAPPEKFTYKGAQYTPKQFAESFGFNPDDYIEITSFTHHPFFSKFELEIPDNWSKNQYYNVPIDELMKIIDSSIENGYSIVWSGGVSGKEFSRKFGVATVPLAEEQDSVGEKNDETEAYPVKEKDVTQEMHQQTFDNRTTFDDHSMHIIGIAKDQNGKKYYYTKNSWGTKTKKYKGYWYLSDAYARLKVISIMVNKNAIPADIQLKLGINSITK